jgi:hypothetical protein
VEFDKRESSEGFGPRPGMIGIELEQILGMTDDRTKALAQFLSRVQSLQDGGFSWGEAVRDARRTTPLSVTDGVMIILSNGEVLYRD